MTGTHPPHSRALSPAAPRAFRLWAAAGALLAAGAATPLAAQCPDGTPPPCRALAPRGVAGPPPNSVAVLYFEAHDTADAYLAEGLTEEIATSLGRIARLQVKSPSAVRRVQREAAGDLRAIGRGLGVHWVVEGTVRRGGAQLRVSVRLVNAANETATWTEAYTRPASDLLAIQGDIAREVATGISGALAPTERVRLAARPTINPEAYDHYIRGNYFFGRRTEAALTRAAQEYQAALYLDPAFAAARARIAMCLGQQVDYGWSPPADNPAVIARGLALADSVIAQDPSVAQGWIARGYMLMFRNPTTLAGSRAALEHAAVLDPRDPEAWMRLATMHLVLGQDSATVVNARRVLALDADRPAPWQLLGITAYYQRRYPEALALFDTSLAVEPSYGRSSFWRSRVRLALGDTAGARADAAVARERTSPGGRTLGIDAGILPLGLSHEAEAFLGRLEHTPLDLLSCVRVGRSPEFDPVRGDPRFARAVAECATLREVP
jgi:adenylate cyclase